MTGALQYSLLERLDCNQTFQMATSADLKWEENLMAHWMSNASRAGVILNPAFPSSKTTKAISNDNASVGLGVNLLRSSSSTSLSEDSLYREKALESCSPCEEKLDTSKTFPSTSLAKKEPMEMVNDAPAQWEALQTNFERNQLYDPDEACYNDLLLRKLEQLKGLQQQKQEQLKRQQMGQIQRLMGEQQKLVFMASEQQGHIDNAYWDDAAHVSPPAGQRDSLRKLNNDQVSKRALSVDLPCEKKSLDMPFKMQDELKDSEQNVTSERSSLSQEQNPGGGADSGIRCESTGNVKTSDSLTGGKDLENLNAEDRPIPASIQERKQTFEQFLEEQIRLEEQRLNQKGSLKDTGKSAFQKPITKRPFLKRGEGLSRFTNAKYKVARQNESEVTLHSNASEVKITVKTDKPPLHRKTTPIIKEQASDNLVSKNGNRIARTSKGFAVPSRKTAMLKNCTGKSILPSIRPNPSGWKAGKLRDSIRPETNGERERNKQNMEIAQLDEISSKLPGEKHQQPGQLTDALSHPECLADCSEKDSELSFELSFQKKLENWDTDKEQEKIELDEFLFLEQAADEISFASNSSLIIKILDQGQQISTGHRLSSTPVKSEWQQQQRNMLDNRNGEDGVPHFNIERDRGNVAKSQAPEIMDNRSKTGDKSLQTFPRAQFQGFGNTDWNEDESQGSSDTSFESEEEFETTIKPASKEAKKLALNNRDASPEFSEHNGLGQDTSKGASPLLEKGFGSDQSSELILDKVAESQTLCCANQEKVEFDDERSWSDFEENGSQCIQEPNNEMVIKVPLSMDCTARSEACLPDKVIKRKTATGRKGDAVSKQSVTESEVTAPPTTDLMMKLFPSLRPKQKIEAPQRHDSQPSTTREELIDTARSQLLREKLVELETEIERFRAENASLSKLREERETALENLRKEIASFEQQKTKELAQLEEFKKEETRKLQKERKVFEKYALAARAIPDKRERDEIKALKQQVATLQEDLKRRETKWSTTHMRLRDQIEALTRDNMQLREEIKIMERFRLEAWKRKEASANKRKDDGCVHSKRAESTHMPAILQKSQTLSSVPQADKSSKTNGRSDWPPEGRHFERPRLATAHDESCLDNMAMTSEDCSKTFMVVSKNLPDNRVVASTAVTPDLAENEEEVEREASHPDGKVEKILKSGCQLIFFPNGTRKEVSCDGKTTTVTFFNGDVKQVLEDQSVIYYYADAKTTHTTYPTGLEVLHFLNGQTEKHFPDGKKEVVFPDQTIMNVFPDGREETIFPDGTIVRVQQDRSKIIEFNNGQQELHTAHFKRREYPDGTIKTVYADGRQETKYASGRIRVKDKNGDVIIDTLP
ncbi:centromere protein J isoform X2 [Hemicordylus capensis]|uniref:centromere protein J isoform X2 n=1 Tax=Hemicordylus capensis TaxID=884348 RepID=UPI00230217A3|nr:centromere protein J isoform X2 [Hemicordylus capensis]